MQKVLVVGYVWPESKTTAAGNRMLQLLAYFKGNHYHITFATTASKTSYSDDLQELEVNEQTITLNDSSFDSFVKELQPNLVVFDRFMVEEQFGWRVAEACPKALRLLNTEDLHSLRAFRKLCANTAKEFTTTAWLAQETTKRELASIYRSDLTLVVSTFEYDLLVNQLGISSQLVMHLPFMFSKITKDNQKLWPSFQQRQDFITFGNGKHAPNTDAIRQLKKVVWPKIRKELPNANLHVYGAYLPESVLQLHQPKEGFIIHGWIDDLETKVKQARLVLAPLRFGAGIKGKLALAMQCGTPNVTTTIGAEGMQSGTHWPGRVEDDMTAFAKKRCQS